MKTFKEFCEQRDRELEEGLGQWIGKGVDMGAHALGRLGNAAVSGLGHGVMQGAKRGWGAMTQGQASNQAHNWGLMAQKAAASGDPQQFKVAANTVYKQMRQAQNQSQPQGVQPMPAPQQQRTAGAGVQPMPVPQQQRAASRARPMPVPQR